jgi:hypothetical protein
MFSTVFLCVKEKNKYVFTCKEFQSFIEADHYFKNKYTVINNNLTATGYNPVAVNNNPTVVNNNPVAISYNPAVIPICKFMPQIIKRQVLQFKLSNIFNRISIV